MQATARAKFQRGSARKMRLVADVVRGKSVNEALSMLAVMPRAAAVPVRKTVLSATANALAVEGTAHLKSDDLRITRIFVDGGPVMKRIRPMAMGRAYRIKKRLCHLTVVVEGEHTPEQTKGDRKAGQVEAKATPRKRPAKQRTRTRGSSTKRTQQHKTAAEGEG